MWCPRLHALRMQITKPTQRGARLTNAQKRDPMTITMNHPKVVHWTLSISIKTDGMDNEITVEYPHTFDTVQKAEDCEQVLVESFARWITSTCITGSFEDTIPL